MITSVQGTSPALRYTQVFPPTPIDPKDISASRYISPIEGIIIFESSGQWPDDLDAIQNTKIAFYLQISELLETNFSLPSIVTHDFIDIIKNGFVFRFVIHHDRDLVLLKKLKKTKELEIVISVFLFFFFFF